MAETTNFLYGLITGVIATSIAAFFQRYLLRDQLRAQKKIFEEQIKNDRENLQVQLKSNEKIVKMQLLFNDQKNALNELSDLLIKNETESFYNKKQAILKFLKSSDGLYLPKDVEDYILKAIDDAGDEIQKTFEEEYGPESEENYDDYDEAAVQEWEDASSEERVQKIADSETNAMTIKIKKSIENYFKI